MKIRPIPPHYNFPIQPLEYFKPIIVEMDGFEGAMTIKVGKYISRWHRKDGINDLKKCRDFLNELIDYEEEKLKMHLQQEDGEEE